MSQFEVDFEWKRDPKRMFALSKKGRRTVMIRGDRERGKTAGKLQLYRPLDEYGSALALAFSKLGSTSDVCDFANKFGPLTNDGLDETIGDDVDLILRMARQMQRLVDSKTADDADEIAELLGDDGIVVSELEVVLDQDPLTSQPRLRVKPKDLLGAIRLKFAEVMSGAVIRQCRQCGKVFEVGPGTGRTLKAQFCSDQHRINFNSKMRSLGGSDK